MSAYMSVLNANTCNSAGEVWIAVHQYCRDYNSVTAASWVGVAAAVAGVVLASPWLFSAGAVSAVVSLVAKGLIIKRSKPKYLFEQHFWTLPKREGEPQEFVVAERRIGFDFFWSDGAQVISAAELKTRNAKWQK